MSEKFSNTYNAIFENANCAKQNQIHDQQSYYQYTSVQMNNSFSHTNSVDLYNTVPSQNCHRNQSNAMAMYQENVDFFNWDNRPMPDVEKVKLPEKIDLLEITNKDLSPASYCSNIDLLVPECYKSSTKDVNYYNNQWYYNTNYSQKNFEFPSCAQVNRNNAETDRSTKYCSIQKSQDLDTMVKNCVYTNDFITDTNDAYYRNIKANDKVQQYNTYNFYEHKFPETHTTVESIENNYFVENLAGPNISFEPLQAIDQQTECSNEESDIIVEESDGEITDYSEEPEKKICYHMNKCIICNMIYTPLGRQFYYLTSESPLTMSSQKPVFDKIVELIGKVHNNRNYLCSECLGLINTIDHLQIKLCSFNSELMTKFENTCKENNIKCQSNPPEQKTTHIKRFYINRLPKYKCKVCKKVLCLKKYCQYHFKRHKFNGYLCEVCGKVYRSRKKFLMHSQGHHKRNLPIISAFKCTSCPKIFRTKSNLVEHENYCLGILPYSCQYCDKKFASATKLKNHVKLKHDKKFIAICSICNIGFIKVSDYKSHMITHSTDKKYSCNKCNKSYKTLSNLNFHMKIHNEKMPFMCTICDKGFMRKEYLEAHVNNHNGIKNFACSICDKKFVSQKNLDSHLKYHEGSVKKNKCNICGKTMTTGFEEHLRIHNNLREFECDQCQLKFNTKGTLAKHKKNKHTNVNSPES